MSTTGRTADLVMPQPTPEPSDRPAIWDLVIKDMAARDKEGRRRYGTPLQTWNGRDALVDLYQELLDAVVYTRQVIEEQDEARTRFEAFRESFSSAGSDTERAVCTKEYLEWASGK